MGQEVLKNDMAEGRDTLYTHCTHTHTHTHTHTTHHLTSPPPINHPAPTLVSPPRTSCSTQWLCSGPPFRVEGTSVFCSDGERMALMGDSTEILRTLATDPSYADTRVVYVSRTDHDDWAQELLGLQVVEGTEGKTMRDISTEPELNQIYPDRKTVHFGRIHAASGVAYRDMLFFDNEQRNVRDVAGLGVTSVHTPDGMTSALWKEGLASWNSEEGSQGMKGLQGLRTHNDTHALHGQNGCKVTKCAAGGSAAATGKILPHDWIIAINGKDVSQDTKTGVIDVLKAAMGGNAMGGEAVGGEAVGGEGTVGEGTVTLRFRRENIVEAVMTGVEFEVVVSTVGKLGVGLIHRNLDSGD